MSAGAERPQAVGYLDDLAGWLEQHGGFTVEREYDGAVRSGRRGGVRGGG